MAHDRQCTKLSQLQIRAPLDAQPVQIVYDSVLIAISRSALFRCRGNRRCGPAPRALAGPVCILTSPPTMFVASSNRKTLFLPTPAMARIGLSRVGTVDRFAQAIGARAVRSC